MGQKINPIGLRLGINRTWESRWYANTAEYGDLLHQDLAIRAFLMSELKAASVARIIIERPHKTCRITIYTACLLYTSPSPRDGLLSRMPSSA